MAKFKDMKVGSKILLGFGTVLAFMVILAVVVLITNTSTITNIKNSSSVSDVQTVGNTLLDTYNDARIGANILYYVIKDDEYTRVSADYDAAHGYLADMKKMSKDYDVLNKFSGEIDTVGSSIDDWYNAVTNLQNANERMAAVKLELQTNGKTLLNTADSAFNTVYTAITAEANKGSIDGATIRRQLEMLDESKSMISGVLETRRNLALLTETYNLDNVGNLPQTIESTITSYEMLISNLSGDNKVSIQAALDDYKSYADTANKFIEVCTESNNYISASEAQGETTTAMVLALSAKFDEAMSSNFNSTTSSATMALTVIIILAVIAIALGLTLAMIIMRSITVPLAKMFKTTDIVATTGRMIFTAEETAETRSAISGDEIGQTVASFASMMDRLSEMAGELERLAEGDLRIDIKTISNEDTMGNAINKTVDNLNEMFQSINAAADQVSSGSKQIADGSQTLATGSTEQASSVEELSSAVYEIADATKANAELATKASNLVDNVKRDAQEGENEMGKMMDAVREISESSTNINKVIKVIDDIAFQTNILALNAAVEAARAGAAGKGFAVVADEVRNLASKSAEAAKNTSAMISTSIEKSELGTKIADETAKSLAKIVSGVNESTTIINQIADSSKEQAYKIDQINIGINQVSEVVQQNSATAEESAAASEEMNGQTVVLADLIAQFKLK